VRGVGEYLKRWGFTQQKPFWRTHEQSPVAVQRWRRECASEADVRP
jgi:transposase